MAFVLFFFILFFSCSIFAEDCANSLYQEFKRTDCKLLSEENYQIPLSSDEFKISQLQQGPLGVCYSCTIKTLIEHYLKKEKVISPEDEIDLNDIINKNNGGYFIESNYTELALEQLKKYGEVTLKGDDYYPYEQICALSGKSPLKIYLNEVNKIKEQFKDKEFDETTCTLMTKRLAAEIGVPEDFLHLREMVEAIKQTKILHPFSLESIKGITGHKNPTSKMMAQCLSRNIQQSTTTTTTATTTTTNTKKRVVAIPPFNTILNCYNSKSTNNSIKQSLLSQLSKGMPMGISVSGHEIVLHGYKKMLCEDYKGNNNIVELLDIRNSWGNSCSGTYLATPFYNILKESNCSVSIEKCIPGKTCLSYIQVQDNQSWKALYTLASLGDINNYSRYKNERTSFDKSDFTFGTMLKNAVQNNQLSMVSFLIENETQGRSSKNIFNGFAGTTPLLLAVKNNYFDIVKTLLYSPLISGTNKIDQLDILYSIAIEDNNKLQQAFNKYGSSICNLELLDGTTAVMLAVASDNPKTLKMVLDNCNPNIIGENATDKVPPLLFAARNGQLEIMKQLLEHPKINPLLKDGSDNTLLLAALENANKNIDLFNYLVSIPTITSTQVNIKNKQGLTPLLKASTIIDKKILISLITAGAKNIEDTNIQGETPLHLALKKGFVAVTRELLKLPGAVDIFFKSKNSEGKTPLQLAVDVHKQNMISALAKEFLSDPNMLIPQSGEFEEASLLFWAIDRNELAAVEMLLSLEKIDPNIGTKSGITPLMLAKKRNNIEIVNLLEKKLN
ncbi:MAG: ankyrin repeat domain-containing protein [Oligoflexia bacterium]|nr:ankyrin repeat domain-containing protein [Oligoflexia bacterium]